MNKVTEITPAPGAESQIKTNAAAAEKIAEAAKAEPDVGTYTHKFKAPVNYQGVIIDELIFNWGQLTGTDHLDIENEMLLRGKTLVTPEFSGDFLWGMAVRACTKRDEDGIRVLKTDAAQFIPIRDFQLICKKARAFLLRAESKPGKTDFGSVSNT